MTAKTCTGRVSHRDSDENEQFRAIARDIWIQMRFRILTDDGQTVKLLSESSEMSHP